MTTHFINEFLCIFYCNVTNGADSLIVEGDAVEFIGIYKHLRSESSRDELRR